MDATTNTPATNTKAHTPSADSAKVLAEDLVADWKALMQQTCRLLSRLREFDLQRGYAQPRKGGRRASSCVDWLHGSLGINRDAGREALRVAYALLNLPRIEDAFEAGELSYRKVRALTATVNAADEAGVLDFARVMTDAQVECYCRTIGGQRSAGGTVPQRPPPEDADAALAVA